MITYMILVLMVNCATPKSFNALDSTIPPYKEANYAFASAKLYLEKELPQEVSITEPEAHVHYAFATIVKVVSELAFSVRPTDPPQRYNPIEVLNNNILTTREEYYSIANATKDVISEAVMKIKPITKIIEKKCHSTKDEFCNEKVAITIKAGDSDMKKRAKLFLQLGKASEYVQSYSNLLNVVIADNKEISYLRHHILDPYVKKLMKEFAATYNVLKTVK